MKSLIKTALVVIGLSLTAIPSLRADETAPKADRPGKQAGGHGAEMKERQEKVMNELGCTDEQKAKIKEIRKQETAEMQALPKEERRSPKGRDIMLKYREQVRAVLTPEQQKKFDEMLPAPGKGQKGEGKQGKKAKSAE